MRRVAPGGGHGRTAVSRSTNAQPSGPQELTQELRAYASGQHTLGGADAHRNQRERGSSDYLISTLASPRFIPRPSPAQRAVSAPSASAAANGWRLLFVSGRPGFPGRPWPHRCCLWQRDTLCCCRRITHCRFTRCSLRIPRKAPCACAAQRRCNKARGQKKSVVARVRTAAVPEGAAQGVRGLWFCSYR